MSDSVGRPQSVAAFGLYDLYHDGEVFAVAKRSADDHRKYYATLPADDQRRSGAKEVFGRIAYVWDYLPKGGDAAAAIAAARLYPEVARGLTERLRASEGV